MSKTIDNKTESEKEQEKPKEPEPRIDPSTSPYTEHNMEAARRLGIQYHRRRRCYVDEDGCPMRDRFGQPLG